MPSSDTPPSLQRHSATVGSRRNPAGRRLLEVRWEGGRREGIAREWWPDGSPRSEGAFRDDERHGPWTFRTAAGELDGRRSGLYEDGERVAPLSPD